MATAYEHIEGIYGVYPENPEVFNPKKILRVPSPMDNATQLTIESGEPRNLRWIQQMRMPDEPHVQGRVTKRAIRLEQNQ